MTDRELVARIARSAGQKAGYKQLVRELSLGGGRERRLLLEQLARLTVRGQLAKLDREHWCIPKPVAGTRENLAAGRLDLHRDGYGFVRPNPRQASVRGIEEDIFIPPNEINDAMQGDQVLVEVTDNGIGIKEDVSHKIYAPYFTTKSSARNYIGSSLFIVKRMVLEEYRGRILCSSEWMKGTTILIEIPANG